MKSDLKNYQQAAKIRFALDETFGVGPSMDILVRSAQEIEDQTSNGSSFFKDILATGRLL